MAILYQLSIQISCTVDSTGHGAYPLFFGQGFYGLCLIPILSAFQELLYFLLRRRDKWQVFFL